MQKQNEESKKLPKEDIEFRKLLKGLVITQTHLEILDDIKEISTFYRQSNKNKINNLSKELESTLGNQFNKIFMRDEKSFITVINDIDIIAEWIATNSFEDVNALAEVMKNGTLQFINSDDNEKKEKI